MGRLQDKIAIITGGASGIGERLAMLFKDEGATVIAADINEDALKKVSEIEGIHGKKLDVTNEDDWANMLKEVKEEFGAIDILINNAGVSTEKQLHETDYAVWEFMLKINGFGTMMGMKHTLPYMKEAGKGAIVNLSSVTALVGMGLNTYTAAKGSVRAITKAAATEYGQFNVRINAVFPGVIQTPMTEGLESSSEQLQRINAMTPLQRLGKPEEVGNAILFLASDEASFITGAELAIDGGYSAL
ncbi:3(or 17)-beta-hydroxysteroid dehydrogenase [Lentibacillus sp. JNUCC-1]|uniref:SDR family NAD(P)-dependent oxidoreductase n=1 Tax=Lentibacillus sp. JNUCC-1 TaxID=2654513 RepID=UPI0012E8CF5E|nr:SDR family oxidoreductase [Lentibacillus sp. JNUCC-1]MUV37553.1 3(or 17)-beta-hydroxysteroid dehydrogenase [Lentibacillus sp. JNUCC-1]